MKSGAPAGKGSQSEDVRQPPGLAFEKEVLGAMILNRSIAGKVSELLRPDDFFDEAHQKVFTAVVTLHKYGRTTDTATLVEYLKERGELEEFGGMEFLQELLDDCIVDPKSVWRSVTVIKRLAEMDEDDRMMICTEPICAKCKHLVMACRREPYCKAFPEGIPDTIFAGRYNHRRLFPGDNGVRFEPIMNIEDDDAYPADVYLQEDDFDW